MLTCTGFAKLYNVIECLKEGLVLTVGFHGVTAFANSRTVALVSLQQETTRGVRTSAVAEATRIIDYGQVFN